MKTTLHHFAYTITPGSLELVLELFEKMGCELAYREGDARWCLIWQKKIPIDIQIIETEDEVAPTEIKTSTHIAFVSEDPRGDIDEIEAWTRENEVGFIRGGWSEKELWFDLPDIFGNFVVEIMKPPVAE
ncbi:hypothetical protein ACFL08_01655 [Patescibacteria group bacterium]